MTDSSTGIRKMYIWSPNFGLWIHLRALGFSIKGFYKQLVEILKLWPWASKLSSTGQSNGSAENCPLGINMLGNMKRVQIRCFPRSSQTTLIGPQPIYLAIWRRFEGSPHLTFFGPQKPDQSSMHFNSRPSSADKMWQCFVASSKVADQ